MGHARVSLRRQAPQGGACPVEDSAALIRALVELDLQARNADAGQPLHAANPQKLRTL